MNGATAEADMGWSGIVDVDVEPERPATWSPRCRPGRIP